MTTNRPALSPRFLVSETFLLTCFAIAAFKLPFHSELSWQIVPSGSDGLVEILSQAFVMMLLVILERLSQGSTRQVVAVLAIGVVAQATGSALLAFPLESSPLQASIAFGLRGAGSAPFLLAIGWVLGSMKPSCSALCIVGGQLLAYLVPQIGNGLPSAVTPFLLCLLPVIDAACLFFVIRKLRSSTDAREDDGPAQSRGSIIECVCLLVICATSKVALALFTPIPHSEATSLRLLISIVIYLGIFLAYFTWICVLKHRDPDRLWPFLMLIVFAGLFACSSLSALAPDFASTFLRATQNTIMLFSWVFLASAIYQRRLPAIPVFCLGQLAISQIPYLITSFITVNGLRVGFENQEVLTVITTSILALAVIGGTFAVVMRSNAPKTAGDQTLSPDETLKASVDALAQTYSLSERESEVALLVAKGYTLTAVGEILFISLNTVRVHSRNLYKKLGIHNKNELLRLLDQQGERQG
ncbi:helix-turn-helix domain-containing protein [Adlercreutzia aquisgranensis]|uniref:helix-turn-helix domain-containing protein n=1 Tax=Adlercreutzia aquisgranensis TaxID=2941323 RepID=UPI00203CE382|nr:helix-turn-helix transcriptional regulator [Adlercreutzia aquisgranensis]